MGQFSFLGMILCLLGAGNAWAVKETPKEEEPPLSQVARYLGPPAPDGSFDRKEGSLSEDERLARGLQTLATLLKAQEDAFTDTQKIAAYKLFLLLKAKPRFMAKMGTELTPADLALRGPLPLLSLRERWHQWTWTHGLQPLDEVSSMPFIMVYTVSYMVYHQTQSPRAVKICAASLLGALAYGGVMYERQRHMSTLRRQVLTQK